MPPSLIRAPASKPGLMLERKDGQSVVLQIPVEYGADGTPCKRKIAAIVTPMRSVGAAGCDKIRFRFEIGDAPQTVTLDGETVIWNLPGGREASVTRVKSRPGVMKLRFTAPPDVAIVRQELLGADGRQSFNRGDGKSAGESGPRAA